MAAQLFLNEAKYLEFEVEVPNERWFRHQRKGLGYEAWLYAMVRVAKCEEVLQWGFDETSLDGTPTLNQWVLIEEGIEGPSVITIECCGLMVGSTAEEIAEHIRASWDTGDATYPALSYHTLTAHLVPYSLGQQCVDLLRLELGPMKADYHVPLVKGGVQLHKLQGVMHDTCNTASRTTRTP